MNLKMICTPGLSWLLQNVTLLWNIFAFNIICWRGSVGGKHFTKKYVKISDSEAAWKERYFCFSAVSDPVVASKIAPSDFHLWVFIPVCNPPSFEWVLGLMTWFQSTRYGRSNGISLLRLSYRRLAFVLLILSVSRSVSLSLSFPAVAVNVYPTQGLWEQEKLWLVTGTNTQCGTALLERQFSN